MPRIRIAIVGGRLQGIEAAYLCSKAAYETVLIDSDADPPAKGLADEFHQLDITRKAAKAKHVLRACDAVLPANENIRALRVLQKLCNELCIPFMQDNKAFSITSDKLKSIELLGKSGIPTPETWPESGFPVIVKPAKKSGSESVYRADDKNQLRKMVEIVRKVDDNPVVQEFIEGQALSLEVISRNGVGQPLQITGLEFDEGYGCKRVYAPVKLSSEIEKRMKAIGMEIALALGLNGLTDVQAMLKRLTPNVNEINARLPSQTPSVVYHSTKVNIAKLLTELFLYNKLVSVEIHSEHAVLYQHVKVLGKELRVQGEHVMVDASGLRVETDFLGADEAITNLKMGDEGTNRVATLIVKSHYVSTALKRMGEAVRNIMSEYGLDRFTDPSPTRRC